MPLTLTIQNELAVQLSPYAAKIPEILKLGIREWRARGQSGYAGLSDVFEKLASLPTPEEVLALRPTKALQERLDALLDKQRQSTWTADEQREWDQLRYVEHLVRVAKANATDKLRRML